MAALQGLSTLWALISEGMADRFGVASCSPGKLGLSSACTGGAEGSGWGCPSSPGRDVSPSEGCSVSEVPGHLWQRGELCRHEAGLDGLFN